MRRFLLFSKAESLDYNLSDCRTLGIESLEERALLSVTPLEYSQILQNYSSFDLPAECSQINIQELSGEQINYTELKAAIQNALKTSTDDLIILRTTESNHSIELTKESEELRFNYDIAYCGKLTIIALGDNALTVDGSRATRIVYVGTKTELQLGNLILQNGIASAGLNIKDHFGFSLNIGAGGGIANFGKLRLAKVSVENCTVTSQKTNDSNFTFHSVGGGIYNGGLLWLDDCIIAGNHAQSGPGGQYRVAPYGAGAGLFNDNGATVEINNTSIYNNVSESGTVKVTVEVTDEDGEVTGYEECEVEQTGQGGGIYNKAGTLVLNRSYVYNNTASYGAGIYNDMYKISSEDIIYANMTINFSDISANTALKCYGGLFNAQRCSLTVDCSTFYKNTATENGGAIGNEGILTVTSSVISGNSAGILGGGCYSAGNYVVGLVRFTVTLTNVTITGNTAGSNTTTGSGGGLWFNDYQAEVDRYYAQLFLNNSIIVQNEVINPSNSTLDKNIVSGKYISGTSNLTTFTNWYSIIPNVVNTNTVYDSSIPLFVKNYNFNTKELGDYHLLLDLNSQAVNKGSNTSVTANMKYDLDGNNRICYIVDRGAYEIITIKLNTPLLRIVEVNDYAFAFNLSSVYGAQEYLLCYSSSPSMSNATSVKLTRPGLFSLRDYIPQNGTWYLSVCAPGDNGKLLDSDWAPVTTITLSEQLFPVTLSGPVTCYKVQEGFSFLANVTSNSSEVDYYWDLNADGVIDGTGPSLEIDSGLLSFYSNLNATVLVYAMKNEQLMAEPLFLQVERIPLTPDFFVEFNSTSLSQVVKLSVQAFFRTDNFIGQWIINWGDDSGTTICDRTSSELSLFHYYSNVGLYTISLKVNDNAHFWSEMTYFLGDCHVSYGASSDDISQNVLASEIATLTMKPSFPIPAILTSITNYPSKADHSVLTQEVGCANSSMDLSLDLLNTITNSSFFATRNRSSFYEKSIYYRIDPFFLSRVEKNYKKNLFWESFEEGQFFDEESLFDEYLISYSEGQDWKVDQCCEQLSNTDEIFDEELIETLLNSDF